MGSNQHLIRSLQRLKFAAAIGAIAFARNAIAGVAIYGGASVAPATGPYVVTASPAFAAGGLGVGFISNDAHMKWHFSQWDSSGNVTVLASVGSDGSMSGSTLPDYQVGGLSRDGTAIGTAAGEPVMWANGVATPTILVSDNASTTSWRGEALAMNASGVIAGGVSNATADSSGIEHAVRWDAHGTTATALASPAGRSVAQAVAPDGRMAGQITTDAGTASARWSADGSSFEALSAPVPSKPNNSYSVLRINSAGAVLAQGASTNPNGSVGVRWDAIGTPTLLLPANGESFAADLNEVGIAVGYDYSKALRWDPGSGTPVILPNLKPSQPANAASSAFAINNTGSIVGRSSLSTGGFTATLWTSTGTPIDLATLLPAGSGWTALRDGFDIDDAGWVVGDGTFDPDGSGPTPAVTRFFSMLVPIAGTYGEGDANFDGKIDFSDLVILAQHYGQSSGNSTFVGDFDLNGVVDFNDLVTLAQHYQGTDAALTGLSSDPRFVTDWTLAQALLPEPTLLLTCMTSAALLRTRRRR